jgi:hypothetical protein
MRESERPIELRIEMRPNSEMVDTWPYRCGSLAEGEMEVKSEADINGDAVQA